MTINEVNNACELTTTTINYINNTVDELIKSAFEHCTDYGIKQATRAYHTAATKFFNSNHSFNEMTKFGRTCYNIQKKWEIK